MRWQQQFTNEELVRRTGLTAKYTTIHVWRMSDERIPKVRRVVGDKRNDGRPRLRNKRAFKPFNIGFVEKKEFSDDLIKWSSFPSEMICVSDSQIRRPKKMTIFFPFFILYSCFSLFFVCLYWCFIRITVLWTRPTRPSSAVSGPLTKI